MRSMVFTSLCRYSALMPRSLRNVERSSAICLVRVVASARPPRLMTVSASPMKSATCPRYDASPSTSPPTPEPSAMGRTTSSGSMRPVGRMICSTFCPWGGTLCSFSYAPGVAEVKMTWPMSFSNSSNLSGRLSRADGRRKPCSTSTSLRERSPAYIPPICETVTCDSSMTVRKSAEPSFLCGK